MLIFFESFHAAEMRLPTYTLLAMLAVSAECRIKVTPINQAAPLVLTNLATAHIAHETHKSLFYINLTEFESLPSTIEKSITLTESLCNELKAKEPCEAAINQLNVQLYNVKRESTELKAQRSKRSLCN